MNQFVKTGAPSPSNIGRRQVPVDVFTLQCVRHHKGLVERGQFCTVVKRRPWIRCIWM